MFITTSAVEDYRKVLTPCWQQDFQICLKFQEKLLVLNVILCKWDWGLFVQILFEFQ